MTHPSETEVSTIPDGPPARHRVDVLAVGETRWATNALRFDTEAEGLAYAHDLYGRWTLTRKMRVVPDSTPEREPYVPGSEHPDWAGR